MTTKRHGKGVIGAHHKPSLRDRPMALGYALRELMDILDCTCPDVSRTTRHKIKVKLNHALILDLKVAGRAPSKNECEAMVYGEATPGPTSIPSIIMSYKVPKDLEKLFPNLVKALNELLR